MLKLSSKTVRLTNRNNLDHESSLCQLPIFYSVVFHPVHFEEGLVKSARIVLGNTQKKPDIWTYFGSNFRTKSFWLISFSSFYKCMKELSSVLFPTNQASLRHSQTGICLRSTPQEKQSLNRLLVRPQKNALSETMLSLFAAPHQS